MGLGDADQKLYLYIFLLGGMTQSHIWDVTSTFIKPNSGKKKVQWIFFFLLENICLQNIYMENFI